MNPILCSIKRRLKDNSICFYIEPSEKRNRFSRHLLTYVGSLNFLAYYMPKMSYWWNFLKFKLLYPCKCANNLGFAGKMRSTLLLSLTRLWWVSDKSWMDFGWKVLKSWILIQVRCCQNGVISHENPQATWSVLGRRNNIRFLLILDFSDFWAFFCAS